MKKRVSILIIILICLLAIVILASQILPSVDKRLIRNSDFGYLNIDNSPRWFFTDTVSHASSSLITNAFANYEFIEFNSANDNIIVKGSPSIGLSPTIGSLASHIGTDEIGFFSYPNYCTFLIDVGKIERVNEQGHVIGIVDSFVSIINVSDCNAREQLLDLQEIGVETDLVMGVSFSGKNLLALDLGSESVDDSPLGDILIIDIQNKEIVQTIQNATNPEFFNKSYRLAIVTNDAVEIIDIAESGDLDYLSRVLFEVADYNISDWQNTRLPIPRWNNDGSTIIFHEAVGLSTDLSQWGEYRIYTYDIDEHNKDAVIVGGINPFWIRND